MNELNMVTIHHIIMKESILFIHKVLFNSRPQVILKIFSYSLNNNLNILFLVAVFICFLIFWTPHHIQRIMSLIVTKLGTWTTNLREIQETLHLVAGTLK